MLYWYGNTVEDAMRKIWLAGLAVPIILAACGRTAAQPSGPPVDRDFAVAEFDRMEVHGPYAVEVTTGSPASAQATGPEAALDDLKVEVRNGTLRIEPRERGSRNWRDGEPVRLAIRVPRLVAVTLAGSGEVAVDRIAGESFDAALNGSGDLRIGSVPVRRLKAALAGSGDLSIGSGEAEDAGYSLAGSGDIAASGVRAADATVDLAGSGDVHVQATRTARIAIVGSGDARVSGGARCTVSKVGSGEAHCS